MRVLPPISIRDAMLTSTSVAESDYSAWASGTTYAVGDRVMISTRASTVTISVASPGVVTWSANGLPDGTPLTLSTTGALPSGLTAGAIYYVLNRKAGSFQLSSEPGGAPIVTLGTQSGTHTATAQVHKNYESLAASNIGNPPPIDDGTKWFDLGPTNRWAPFDNLRDTGATDTGPLTYVITPGERIDAIGLMGMVADSVTVTVTVGASTVYTYTENLSTRSVATWYDYFFKAFTYKSDLGLFDLPPYTNGIITVSLSRLSGAPTIGGIFIGSSIYIGGIQYGATAGARNFSKFDRDDFGNARFVKRRSIPRKTFNCRVTKENAQNVLNLQDTLNAVPCLWSGLDDPAHPYFQPFFVFGVYQKLDLVPDQESHAMLQGEVEGY